MRPLVEPGPELSPAEIARYSRHLSLPDVGVTGQRRLRAAKILVIGAGGLGAPVLQYLGAAGIGQLTVIDDDVVDVSNLQRQILHRDADVGRPKVESARDALLRLDPGLTVETVAERLSPDNALELFAAHDLVIDGADNFATRYLSNDAAELTGTPLVWGTIFRFEGQVSTFAPGHGPMLRDLFPDIPDADSVPSCAEGGVLGVLCGLVGSLMAAEAIKLICGIGDPLLGRLLRVDALSTSFTTLRFSPDPDRPAVTDLAEVALACAAPAVGAPAPAGVAEVTADEVRALTSAPVIVDVREAWERELEAIPGSVHVPLDVVVDRGWPSLAEAVGPATDIVVHCRSGVRSARAVSAVSSEAPSDVRIRSLAGGIEAWTATESTPVR
ncbi:MULTISPECIES: molybdopterin-synthase adenylyltransferase MoeB [unclassified Brevibacterium]|uniref:molybdopterin-synthase adenylyltransferase MoeB n=1 Tax=unclassified Brevibacterium TaxID=2614124 RepID=UPI003643DDFC